jgi:hypothetical protein
VRFEISTTINVQVVSCLVVTPSSDVVRYQHLLLYPDDGGRVGTLPRKYPVSHTRLTLQSV